MTIDDLNRAWAAIRQIAAMEGVTPAEVRIEMAAAIDEAFGSRDPSVRARWLLLFPNGKKPTVEAFILRLSQEISH